MQNLRAAYSQTLRTSSSHLGTHVPTKLQMNPCQYLRQTARMLSLGCISSHKLRVCPRMPRVCSEKLALRCRVIRRHKIALHPRPSRYSCVLEPTQMLSTAEPGALSRTQRSLQAKPRRHRSRTLPQSTDAASHRRVDSTDAGPRLGPFRV